MSEKEYSIDPELLREFLDETTDSLSPLENLLIKLEGEPDNIDVVNSVFRPIHSLKGTAAFFKLMKTRDLSHAVENLLDLIRKKKKKADKEVIRCLLDGLDMLREMLGHVRTGTSEIEAQADYDLVLESLAKNSAEEQAAAPNVEKTVMAAVTMLAELRQWLPSDKIILADEITRILESITTSRRGSTDDNRPAELRGLAKLLDECGVSKPQDGQVDEIGKLLVALRLLADSEETSKTVDAALDEYHTFMGSIGFDPLLVELLKEKCGILSTKAKWRQTEPSTTTPPADNLLTPKADGMNQNPENLDHGPASAKTAEPQVAELDKTLRISEKRLDAFLTYVGELVVVEEMFNFIHRHLASVSGVKTVADRFKQTLDTFSVLSDRLQKSIMTIRKVPVRVLTQKTPRIIHDVADKFGKKVNVVIDGGDIEVDKSYIELLDAPLVHMARNAIDHGIEKPDDRINRGKPPEGTVHIVVKELPDMIELRLSDDGKGIDYEAVRRKAVEMSMIKPDASLDERQLVDLLFMSGLSTAEKVTDISGRGVGMDVVKRNIDSAGGVISISSVPGKGSEFSISLPKNISTQIIEGFLVEAGGQTYVLTTAEIRESFSLDDSGISTMFDRCEVVSRNGVILPVLRLGVLLGYRTIEEEMASNHHVICIEASGRQYAIYVDRIIGIQKVVVKRIMRLTADFDLFKGAAITGDGKVVLIIDSLEMVRMAEGAEGTSDEKQSGGK